MWKTARAEGAGVPPRCGSCGGGGRKAAYHSDGENMAQKMIIRPLVGWNGANSEDAACRWRQGGAMKEKAWITVHAPPLYAKSITLASLWRKITLRGRAKDWTCGQPGTPSLCNTFSVSLLSPLLLCLSFSPAATFAPCSLLTPALLLSSTPAPACLLSPAPALSEKAAWRGRQWRYVHQGDVSGVAIKRVTRQ